MRDRLRRWFHRPAHVRPATLEEAIDTIEGNRKVIRLQGWSLAFLVLALPIVTLIAVTVGERGRDQNCEVVEGAFHGFSDGIVDTLLVNSAPPKNDDERERQERIATGLRTGFHANVDDLMEDCG
jgi:hypothetical protein